MQSYYRKGKPKYIQVWLGRKSQLLRGQTCHVPHPSLMEKGAINEQTSLAVVINVHLPVFLMGHLIKNLLVAAGLLSHPITAPPCQNLCHWPSFPIPHSNTSLVSHMTSVSRGPVMECCSPAMPPQVLPAGRHPFCSHAGAVAE